MRYAIMLSCLPLCLLVACKGSDTHSPVAAPGAPPAAKTVALDKGAALLQSKPPIDAINSYLDGFHFYHGNIKDGGTSLLRHSQ
jgi:hypothetical protein